MELPWDNCLFKRFVIYLFIVFMGIKLEEAIVNDCKYLIHSLDVLHAGVQFGIDKQNSVKDVRVGLNVIFGVVWFLISFLGVSLSFQSFKILQ